MHGIVLVSDRGRPKESSMNWDQIKGNWTQVTGRVKGQWGLFGLIRKG